jgi:hypothetical protein
MKKVFLSGPVTGLDYEQVKKNFNQAEQLFLDKDYQVMNPVTFVPAGEDWNKAMRRCLVAISSCNTIYLLKGFEGSRGSTLELVIAHELEMEVIFEDQDLIY